MKIIMSYDMAPDGLSIAKDNIDGHRERLLEFHEKGVLLMAGPLANPTDGAIGIFTNMDAAKDFIEGDLFVKNGVVGKYRLVEWDEGLTK